METINLLLMGGVITAIGVALLYGAIYLIQVSGETEDVIFGIILMIPALPTFITGLGVLIWTLIFSVI